MNNYSVVLDVWCNLTCITIAWPVWSFSPKPFSCHRRLHLTCHRFALHFTGNGRNWLTRRHQVPQLLGSNAQAGLWRYDSHTGWWSPFIYIWWINGLLNLNVVEKALKTTPGQERQWPSPQMTWLTRSMTRSKTIMPDQRKPKHSIATEVGIS